MEGNSAVSFVLSSSVRVDIVSRLATEPNYVFPTLQQGQWKIDQWLPEAVREKYR